MVLIFRLGGARRQDEKAGRRVAKQNTKCFLFVIVEESAPPL